MERTETKYGKVLSVNRNKPRLNRHQSAGYTGFFVPEILAVVAGIFMRMGQNWEKLNFR
jgi:hypothetical protein